MATWKKVVTESSSGVISQKAANVSDADFGDITVSSGSWTIDNNAVTGSKIADNTIVALNIAANAVGASELANNAVDTAAIGADAVTGAKIADDAINSEHYTNASIDAVHLNISSGSGTSGQLLKADGSGGFKWENAAVSSTNLSVTQDGTQLQINSSTGANVDLPVADASNWGILSDDLFTTFNQKMTYFEIGADEDTTGTSAAGYRISNLETLTFASGAGLKTKRGGNSLTIKLDTGYNLLTNSSQTIQGTKTFANNVIVTGNLTVNGTTTTINAATVDVEDKNILLGKGTYADDNAATTAVDGGGISIQTDSGTDATSVGKYADLTWNKAGSLTGWQAKNTQYTSGFPIAIMQFSSNSTAPGSSENAGGVGSFHFDTGNDSLYIRTN